MMDNYLYKFMFMRFLFLLSILFLVLLTGSVSSLQPLCHEDERSALLQFKDSFIINKSASPDPSACSKVALWTPEGEHSDCCLWDGVDCNEDTGHVIGLDLSNSCLYGPINSNSSLFRLLHLQRLKLAHNNFSYSQIPFGVGNLSRLTYLDLSYCVFSGQIPSELSRLSKLSSLHLSGNSDLLYTGSDLTSLAQNLTSLQVLFLSYVNILSVIPQSFANLSSLTALGLGYCQLHGEFPTRIFQLPNLRYLWIGENQNLNGHLPEFHSKSSLEVLILESTSLSGKIPDSIGKLSSLTDFDASHCKFSGSIPPSLTNLTQVIYLDLSSNSLTGHIPNSFSELQSLQNLYLTGNYLSGMLDFDTFLKIKSLSVLMLSSNNLTLLTKANSNDTLPQFHTLALGSCNLQKFPNFLRNQNKLSWLEMGDNNLQGLVPKWLYNISIETFRAILLEQNFLIGFEQSPLVLPWSKLEILDLNSNSLQGTLPIPQPSIKIYQVQKNLIREMSSLICNLSSLYVLDLSYNNLRGNLHPCFGNFSSRLSALQLRSNNFHGTIPKTWVEGSSLEMIDLSENQFQGQLPRSMANCMMLEYLHVGNNQINDTFPFWLGILSRLKVLVLRSNAFHGAIKSPEINYTFPGLHIIDISQNSFFGYLPTEYFLQWNAMKVVGANDLIYMELGFSGEGWGSSVQFSATLTNKGIELEYGKIQDVFKVIDFSSNRFEGEIPKLVGSLKGLHMLNLSNNAFTGYIPPSLGNLTHLESMDLSQNKLFGEIPPQLTQLFFLEAFNVSNNRLRGPIPHGNQFDTFQNSSFGGNLGLCGSPLLKKCGDFEYTPTSPSPFEEINRSVESPFQFGWKVVAIGYGCGFVIGVLIGQIVITRKYDWFVKIFGKM